MSARTKSERLRRLLSHGYFAPELPPCFVSEDLARFRRTILDDIDGLPLNRGRPDHHRFISEPVWFYFPRFGKDDRRHGVPNPIAHLLLSRALADNYVALRRLARQSELSLSPPVFDWTGPRALARPSIDLRDDFRVELSARRETYVAADVRAFFHSIYTHAIAWAIHGKEVAKQQRGVALYGNLIDLLCRNAQDGQTIGLPVGPDTSRLIAEIVASAMDAELQGRLGVNSRDASRYIDDYTLSAPGSETGQELLAELRNTASRFELELNSDKSAVVPTSERQATGWQLAVRNLIPRPRVVGETVPTAALQQYFYELGRLCLDHPEMNVEKFGLQFARSSLVGVEDWRPVQSHLISAYRRNPSLISLLVELCLLRQVTRNDLPLDALREFIEHRMPVLARANRLGEATWLLFLAIRLDISLSSRALAPLSQKENALIATLVVCLQSRGRVQGGVDRSVWDRALTPAGLRGPMWLYAYEAVTRGFLPGVTDAFILQDPYFALLRARAVQFLDIDRGFTSITATLRNLRTTNERMHRLRDAILDRGDEEYEEIYDEDPDDEDDDEIDFAPDLY